MTRLWCLLISINTVVGPWGGTSSAFPESSVKAIPDEVVAVCFSSGPAAISTAGRSAEADPSSEKPGAAGNPDGPSWGAVIETAQRLGLLSAVDPKVRKWIDGLLAAGDVRRFPWAIALLDVRARTRDDGGHELAELHAALVVRTAGDHESIERRIQHLLLTYTSRESSELTVRSEDGGTWHSLRDRRLPPWSHIEWGRQGDFYVVAIGEGTMARVRAAGDGRIRPLGDQPWFTEGFKALAADRATFGLFLDIERLRASADPGLLNKIERTQAALRLVGTDRAFWTVGREGRAVTIDVFAYHAGRNERRNVASAHTLDDRTARLIPPEATWYLILDWDPVAVFRGVCQAVASTRSERKRAQSREFWQEFQRNAGVMVEPDIMAHLGERIIIHDYPEHALRVPVAYTFVIPIRVSEAVVRRGIDRLLSYAMRQYGSDWSVAFEQDGSGAWHLAAGLAGPALGVQHGYWVTSFSPHAVRDNLDRIGKTPFAASTSRPTGDGP